jgi:hypothetical protein
LPGGFPRSWRSSPSQEPLDLAAVEAVVAVGAQTDRAQLSVADKFPHPSWPDAEHRGDVPDREKGSRGSSCGHQCTPLWLSDVLFGYNRHVSANFD